MATTTPRFLGYEQSREVPNIVVDGAPNDSTVLTISHWPGTPPAPTLAADLSAQMCFRYLDHPPPHPPVEAVTNNHYDQDGLVGLFTLTDPERALVHRELLVDVAAAGDFGTYRHRDAARASMVVAAWADDERSPFADDLVGRSHAEQCETLYRETLPLVIDLITDPGRFRALWEDEDAALTASEHAIADGEVTIDERVDLDLAVVTVADSLALSGGHRFGGTEFADLHPLALHNATDRVRLLVAHGARYRYVDRYETWVQYRSRPLPGRVDLRPLAEHLTGLESSTTRWSADPPSALTPSLVPDDDSSLPPDVVRAEVESYLAQAPAAWAPVS